MSSTSIKHWWKDQKPSIKLLKLYVLLVYCFFDPVFLFRLRVLCHNWIIPFVIINYCTDALNVTVMFFFSFFVIFFNEKFLFFFASNWIRYHSIVISINMNGRNILSSIHLHNFLLKFWLVFFVIFYTEPIFVLFI